MNIDVFNTISVRDAFWIELGPIWVPKRGQKGAPKGFKTDPKRAQNPSRLPPLLTLPMAINEYHDNDDGVARCDGAWTGVYW